MKKWDFSERQANAILEMQLGQLTRLSHDDLTKEYNDLQAKIAEYREILGSRRGSREWRALLAPALGAAALLAASVGLLAWNRLAEDPPPPAVSAPGPEAAPAAHVRDASGDSG